MFKKWLLAYFGRKNFLLAILLGGYRWLSLSEGLKLYGFNEIVSKQETRQILKSLPLLNFTFQPVIYGWVICKKHAQQRVEIYSNSRLRVKRFKRNDVNQTHPIANKKCSFKFNVRDLEDEFLIIFNCSKCKSKIEFSLKDYIYIQLTKTNFKLSEKNIILNIDFRELKRRNRKRITILAWLMNGHYKEILKKHSFINLSIYKYWYLFGYDCWGIQNILPKKYIDNNVIKLKKCESNKIDNCVINNKGLILKNNRLITTNDDLISWQSGLWDEISIHNANPEQAYLFFDINKIKKVKQFEKEKVILGLGKNSANYWHMLNEYLPAAFYLLDKKNNFKILVSKKTPNTLRIELKKIFKRNVIEITSGKFYNFRQILIPEKISETSDRDSIPMIDKGVLDIEAMIAWREHLLKIFLKNKVRDSKLCIIREQGNKKVLKKLHLKILGLKGYKFIVPGNMSLEEQINEFYSAKKIVASPGAELANLIFCRPGTEIVCIVSQTVHEVGHVHRKLSQDLDLNFKELVIKEKKLYFTNDPFGFHQHASLGNLSKFDLLKKVLLAYEL